MVSGSIRCVRKWVSHVLEIISLQMDLPCRSLPSWLNALVDCWLRCWIRFPSVSYLWVVFLYERDGEPGTCCRAPVENVALSAPNQRGCMPAIFPSHKSRRHP